MGSRSHPAGQLDVNQALGIMTPLEAFPDQRFPFGSGERDRDGNSPGTPLQSREMIVKPERNPPIRPNYLIDAVAELKASILNRDCRLFNGGKVPVDICDNGHKGNER